MALHQLIDRHCQIVAATQRLQTRLGEVEVLQIIEVLDDGLAHVVALGAPGALGERFKSLFEIFREADRKHGEAP